MIQVYVEELSTYNNGIAVGGWVSIDNFNSELEAILEQATIVLKEHGYYYGVDAEEWEIIDWECEVDINLNSYYQNIDKLKQINELLNDLGNDEIDILNFLLDIGYEIEQIDKDKIFDVRIYSSFEDAVDEFIEYHLEIPSDSKIYSYIDYERIQRDLEIEGYTEVNGKVFLDIS